MVEKLVVGSEEVVFDTVEEITHDLVNGLFRTEAPIDGVWIVLDRRVSVKEIRVVVVFKNIGGVKADTKYHNLEALVDKCGMNEATEEAQYGYLTLNYTDGFRTFKGQVYNLQGIFREGQTQHMRCNFVFWIHEFD